VTFKLDIKFGAFTGLDWAYIHSVMLATAAVGGFPIVAKTKSSNKIDQTISQYKGFKPASHRPTTTVRRCIVMLYENAAD